MKLPVHHQGRTTFDLTATPSGRVARTMIDAVNDRAGFVTRWQTNQEIQRQEAKEARELAVQVIQAQGRILSYAFAVEEQTAMRGIVAEGEAALEKTGLEILENQAIVDEATDALSTAANLATSETEAQVLAKVEEMEAERRITPRRAAQMAEMTQRMTDERVAATMARKRLVEEARNRRISAALGGGG